MLTNLGEEEATIQGFLGNSQGSTTEVCFEGLVYWQKGNADRPVTWETLLKVLRESELKGIADDLEEELTRYIRHRLHMILCARGTYIIPTRTHLCTCTIISRTSVCMMALR